MPALFAPLLGLALGGALGFALGMGTDADEPARVARGTRVAALFGALVYAPACAYFLAFAGDWSYGYFVDASRVPSALELVLAAADAGAVALGFFLSRRALAARRMGAASAVVAAPLGLSLVLAVALAPRLTVDASYAQFQGDYGTRPLVGGPLGLAIVWMGAVVFAGALLAARALRDPASSRRARVSIPAPLAEPPARLLGARGDAQRARREAGRAPRAGGHERGD